MSVSARPRISIEEADARIAAALADPGVREPVKRFLREAENRDPVKAAADAELLSDLLGRRADARLWEARSAVMPDS